LGISQLVFRTFNRYSEENRNGYFSLVLIISVFGCLLSAPFFLYFDHGLFSFDGSISSLIDTVFFSTLLYVLIAARILHISFEAILRMTKSITFIAFMQNFFLKGIPIIFLGLYFFDLINFDGFLVLYILLFILAPLILILYLRRREGLRFGRLSTYSLKEKQDLLSLGGFGMLNTMAASLLLYVDTLMVNEYLREMSVGVYVTMYLFGSVVGVPNRSLKLISGVFIVEAIKSDDFEKVKLINQKSSQSLLVISGVIFALIWGNINSITGYLDPVYSLGASVVFFIGLAQLFDVYAGMSSEILSASKYYWIHTPITLLTIGVAIATNIYLIPQYGIIGAAIATSISFGFLHLSRLLSVALLFKTTPFNQKVLIGTIIASAVITGTMYLPSLGNIYIQVVYKSTLIVTTYGLLMYAFKISTDVNSLVDKYIFNRFKKG